MIKSALGVHLSTLSLGLKQFQVIQTVCFWSQQMHYGRIKKNIMLFTVWDIFETNKQKTDERNKKKIEHKVPLTNIYQGSVKQVNIYSLI